VLSQDCSSAASERNWSTFGLVQTKKRNRLSFSRLKKLVFIQENMKMLEKLEAGEDMKEVNPDLIDISRVPELPSQLEIEDHYAFLYEQEPSQYTRRTQVSRSAVQVLRMPTSNDSQSEELSSSSEIENLSAVSDHDLTQKNISRSSTDDDDNLATSELQDFDSYDPHAFARKRPRFCSISSFYDEEREGPKS